MNIEEAQKILSDKIDYLKSLQDHSFFKYYIFNSFPNVNDEDDTITLQYRFQELKSNTKTTCENMIDILSYTGKYIFNNLSKNLAEYKHDNLKSDIDYINDICEFRDENGKIIDTNKEKIDYFICSLLEIANQPIEKNDYSKFKYTMLMYSDKNNKIMIINKHSPIVKLSKKTRSIPISMFEIEYDDNNNIELKRINRDILKQPIYPTIIIIDDICFLISENAEQLFGFSEYNKDLSSQYIKTLDSKIISFNSSCIDKILKTKKYYNQLASVSEDTINAFDVNIHRKYIEDAGLIVENSMILVNTKADIEKLLDLLLARIEFEDPITGDIYKVRSSKLVSKKEAAT